jgi:tetratricopeptide (TPR) repeat protein
MPDTAWMPALTVLGVAAAAGGVLAWRTRGGTGLPSPQRTARTDRAADKAAAYAMLREHHAARSGWPDADAWSAELDRLERAAAIALRDLETARDAVPTDEGPPPASRPGNPWRGMAWTVATCGFLAGLGWWVQEAATPRAEGQSVTGGQAPGGPDLAALEAQVAAHPNDLDAKNRLGHAYLSAERAMDAFKLAEDVAKVRNDDPEARTHQAIVLLGMGDASTAGRVLDRVLAQTPVMPEALGWRGAIHYQLGEYAEAAARWQAATDADPSLRDQLAPLIAAAKDPATPARRAAEAAAARAAATGPSASPDGAHPSTAEAVADPRDVVGTIDAPTGALRPGDLLFLSARPQGVTSGPPTWVQRLQPTAFPLSFRIGPAHAMLGGDPPAKLVLTARIDRDGDPTTKGPDDLEGRSGVVAPGAADVRITLAR